MHGVTSLKHMSKAICSRLSTPSCQAAVRQLRDGLCGIIDMGAFAVGCSLRKLTYLLPAWTSFENLAASEADTLALRAATLC